MQISVKNIFRHHWRHILSITCIFVICVGLFAAVGITSLPKAATKSTSVIVNDDYAPDPADTSLAYLTAGDEIKQTIEVQGRLYGVAFCIATQEKAVNGILHLEVENNNGDVVSQSIVDMSSLQDHGFCYFLLDTPILMEEKEKNNFTLILTTDSVDTIGFYRSNGPAQSYQPYEEYPPQYDLSSDSFRLYKNNVETNATLIMKYTTQYAGDFLTVPYIFFSCFITLLLIALYILLCIKRVPLHRIFIVASLGFGIVFMFLIPPRFAPDEYYHISTAYHFSNTLMGQEELGAAYAEKEGLNDEQTLTMRAGDAMMLYRYAEGGHDIFAYQSMAENLWQSDPGGEPVVVEARPPYNAYILQYIPQTLGITLARLLGLGQVWMILLGRAGNLLFFTIVASRGIKKMPLAKPLLFCVGILPITLQLAASFCYDTFVLALSFYFVGYCLHCILEKKSPNIKQLVLLTGLAALLAPAKGGIYVLIAALVLFVPFALSKRQKKFLWGIAGIGVLAIGSWLLLNRHIITSLLGSGTAVPTPEEIAASIQPNGESTLYYSFRFALHYPGSTLKMIFNTIITESSIWFKEMMGGFMGEPIAITIEVDWLLIIGMFAILFFTMLPVENKDSLVLKPSIRWVCGGVFLAIVGLSILAAFNWTPVNNKLLFGVQGRYFLPALPLGMLAFRGKNLQWKKDYSYGLCFIMAGLVALCQLQAFSITIA